MPSDQITRVSAATGPLSAVWANPAAGTAVAQNTAASLAWGQRQ
jgi:hypothetical protein